MKAIESQGGDRMRCLQSRCVAAVLLVVAVSPAWGGGVPTAKAVPGVAEGLKLAKSLYAAGKYREAAFVCRRLLQKYPGNEKIESLMYKSEAAYYKRRLALHAKKEKAELRRGELEMKKAAELPSMDAVAKRRVPPEDVIFFLPDVSDERLAAIQKKLNQRVSVNLIDADLAYILSLLFNSCGVNIVADQSMLEQYRLTIHVEDFPLIEILKYIAAQFDNISYVVTPDAVWVTTPEKPMFETRAVRLTYGLTEVTSPGTPDAVSLMQKIPELIDWPDGSAFYLDKKENVLYLKSTPEALDKAVKMLEVIDVVPKQVLIEARFVDLGGGELSDIGVEWKLTSPYVINKKDSGAPKTQVAADSGFSPFSRTGQVAFPGMPDNVPAGFNLTYVGVLSQPQFQAVLHALEGRKDVTTLSCPRLIALNNTTATIEVSRNLLYVKSFKVEYPSVTVVTDQAQASGSQNLPTITPEVGEEQEGIKLEITPSIGKDNRTVMLVIKPAITEKVGEERFDYTFPTPSGQSETRQFTRPVISTRTLETRLAVSDGATIVIGGLMRDHVEDRVVGVPVLSKVPLLGRLFRWRQRVSSKSNLVIFVTATILTAEGTAYEKEKKKD